SAGHDRSGNRAPRGSGSYTAASTCSASPRPPATRSTASCTASARPSGRWVDVVVEPEDVVWIVASLDRDEPSVVGSPDLVHLLPVLGGQVVDVAPVGHVRTERLERLSGPGDVLLRFPLVRPLRDDEQAIARRPVRERGGGGVDPRDGAQIGNDAQAAHG